MRAGRGRALLGRSDLLRRRLCEGLPDQVAGDRHHRGRLGRRLDRLARRAEPAARRAASAGSDAGARSATAAAAPSRPSPTPISSSAGSMPNRFLGGELAPRCRRPRSAAIVERIAGPLGYDGADGAIEMADGIVAIATVIMAGAIRRISVEHGRDPRDFVLFSYGGGGPLHASALARELAIPTVVIPPEPGNFSAIGMLLADARLDTAQDLRRRARRCDRRRDGSGVRGDGGEVGSAAIRARDSAATRWRSSAPPRCAIAASATTSRCRSRASPMRAPIRDAFDRDYQRRYGHADTRAGVEIQALHLSAFGAAATGRTSRACRGRRPRAAAIAAPARCHFGGAGGMARDARLRPLRAGAGLRRRRARPSSRNTARPPWSGRATASRSARSAKSASIARRANRERAHMATTEILSDAAPEVIDPITLEVIRHGIVSITDQIDANITRTAFSPYIYEYKDYAVGMTDADGRADRAMRRRHADLRRRCGRQRGARRARDLRLRAAARGRRDRVQRRRACRASTLTTR